MIEFLICLFALIAALGFAYVFSVQNYLINQKVKPLLWVNLPIETSMSSFADIKNDLNRMQRLQDYTVLVSKGSSRRGIELNIFHEKDFNVVKYEELKAIIEKACTSKS